MDKYLLDCLDKVLAGIFSPAGWSGGAERELAELTDHGCALHGLESGTPFIQCDFPARTVWVLMRGGTQVICYNRRGSCSVQDAPEKPQMFGLMEQISGYPAYTATVETTTVHFAPIPEAQLQAYADTAEPYDKAGAYAIQGRAAVWCSGIEGCYYNIMGLPVHRTAQLLAAFGLQL